MLFADNIEFIEENKEMLKEEMKCWISAIEEGGLKVSSSKTKYMWLGGREMVEDVELLEEKLGRAEKFKYLGSYISENGTLDREIDHKIQAGWFNWNRMSGVLG
ncbi:uncharacterized protein [Diabrotica undecimpunctata]|uniref:uncharacterized protein n=1 Tax=Diabrotica undecimpunctata TaxID=50387 RepID=UPI003B635F3D